MKNKILATLLALTLALSLAACGSKITYKEADAEIRRKAYEKAIKGAGFRQMPEACFLCIWNF